MEVNLHRISSPVPGYETKMIALYERNGLIREVQRREAVYHDGTYYDEYEYGILKPDYKKRNQEGLQ
jgi:RimJ/RimL family protein N-acetyltransferase